MYCNHASTSIKQLSMPDTAPPKRKSESFNQFLWCCTTKYGGGTP